MSKPTKLRFTNITQLSKAVAKHIKPRMVDYISRPIFEDLFLMEPEHWMTVVNSMRDDGFEFSLATFADGWTAENGDRPAGVMVGFRDPLKTDSDTEFFDEPVSGNRIWLAVGLAALRAKGFEVEWKGEK